MNMALTIFLLKNTPSVPIYRRYSFLKKISKYKSLAKFNAEFVE
jgi:hypothetical protein